MAIDAKGLVLMKKENGILEKELGSYEVNDGLELVDKAYVEEDKVKLFLTTSRDVTDDEFNDVYDAYDFEPYENEGYEIEEIDDEYNPVWCITFNFIEEHNDLVDSLNHIIKIHKDQIYKILN